MSPRVVAPSAPPMLTGSLCLAVREEMEYQRMTELVVGCFDTFECFGVGPHERGTCVLVPYWGRGLLSFVGQPSLVLSTSRK